MKELNKNYDAENMDLLIEELETREELKCGCDHQSCVCNGNA